jgi:hypothetical protein
MNPAQTDRREWLAPSVSAARVCRSTAGRLCLDDSAGRPSRPLVLAVTQRVGISRKAETISLEISSRPRLRILAHQECHTSRRATGAQKRSGCSFGVVRRSGAASAHSARIRGTKSPMLDLGHG